MLSIKFFGDQLSATKNFDTKRKRRQKTGFIFL